MSNNGPRPSQDPKSFNDSKNGFNKPYDPNKPYSGKPLPSSSEPSQSQQSRSQYSNGSFKNSSTNSSHDYEKKHDDASQHDSLHKDKYKKTYEEFEGKVKGTFKNIQESEIYHYAQSNKEQTITYVLLALGIILLFINTLLGGLVVGAIAGYHFAPQVIYYLRNLGQIFEGQDQLRYIVLTGLLIGLFIAAPGIFIGAVIVAAFRQLIMSKKPSVDRDLTDKDFRNKPDSNHSSSNSNSNSNFKDRENKL